MNRSRAIIVFDPLNDYVDGPMACAGASDVLAGISEHVLAMHEHQRAYDLVIVARDLHQASSVHFSSHPNWITTFPPHCVEEHDTRRPSIGARFHEAFDLVHSIDYLNLFKGHYASLAVSAWAELVTVSASYACPLHLLLENWEIDEVVLCGLGYDLAITETAFDFAHFGPCKPIVVRDLCIGLRQMRCTKADTTLHYAGIPLVSVAEFMHYTQLVEERDVEPIP